MTLRRCAVELSKATAAVFLFAGCAGVQYGSVKVQLADKTGSNIKEVRAQNLKADLAASPKGIRYYDTSLYLLVYTDGLENVYWKILELPDQSKLRIAKPYNFISSLQANFHFHDGALIRAQEAGDSTKVPQALIEAVGEIAPLLLAADAREDKFEHEVPTPRLYKIVSTVDGDYVLTGGSPSGVTMKVSLEPATLQ